MEQLRREKQHYRQQMEAFGAMRTEQNRVKVQLMNMQRTERKGMCLIASDLMVTCNLIEVRPCCASDELADFAKLQALRAKRESGTPRHVANADIIDFGFSFVPVLTEYHRVCVCSLSATGTVW